MTLPPPTPLVSEKTLRAGEDAALLREQTLPDLLGAGLARQGISTEGRDSHRS